MRRLRELGMAIAACAMLLGAQACQAQTYPSRPVRVFVPSSASSVLDVSTRAWAERMSQRLGQPFTVEFQPGAGGLVALNTVARAEHDGYTILANGSHIMTFPALLKAYSLDLARDFVQITIMVEGRQAIAVHSSIPVRSFDELIAYMKANPGKVNLGVSSGVSALSAELFRAVTGTTFESIRYAGSNQRYQALAAGEINAVLSVATGWAKGMADSGRIRLLAMSGSARDPLLPNLPAMSESSLPEVKSLARSALFMPFWHGPMVPSRTPREIVNLLYTTTREIMKEPEFVKRMRTAELDVVSSPPSPEEASALQVEGATEILKVARQAGVQPQ